MFTKMFLSKDSPQFHSKYEKNSFGATGPSGLFQTPRRSNLLKGENHKKVNRKFNNLKKTDAANFHS